MRVAALLLPTAGAFMLAPAPRLSTWQSRGDLCMKDVVEEPTDYYEEYVKERKSGKVSSKTAPSFEEAEKGYLEFEKYDTDFDGGDSGGGVVGDGNTDLEDQHNSASVVRGGFGSADGAGGGSDQVGRGRVQSATTARVASAGKNYFGRSTGYAEKKIEEMKDEDIKNHKIDYVRAQQLENWFNQRVRADAPRTRRRRRREALPPPTPTPTPHAPPPRAGRAQAEPRPGPGRRLR